MRRLARPNRLIQRVAGFRRHALLLFLLPLPFLALWLLWEGGLYFQIMGIINATEARARAIIAAHRVVSWLLPLTCSIVFSYGIARTEPDVRLAVLGDHDLRLVWARRWLLIASLFSLSIIVVASLLSWWSGESLVRLVGSGVTALLFGIAVSYAVNVWTGTTPGTAAFAVGSIMSVAMLLPMVGLPVWFSLSPGPLGWGRGEAYRWSFLLHDLIILVIAGAIIFMVLIVPRDLRQLRWIVNYRGSDV